MQSADLMPMLSAVSLHVRTTRTDPSSIRVRQDKQLGWPMSSGDSLKQSTDLAVTLWPKIFSPGPTPMRAKQHEHNKSPPRDMSIIEPLVVNFCPCLCARSLLHSNPATTLQLVKPCKKKHFLKNKTKKKNCSLSHCCG